MSTNTQPPRVEITPEEVRDALDRIENSETLGASERLCRFLRYSAEATLAGRSDELNQYEIGLEVFDKPESFDPAVDPIVRVEAARLRERLDRYYSSEGSDDAVRLRFASRGYTTRFERCREADPRPSAAEEGELRRNHSGEEALQANGPLSLAVLPFVDLSPDADQEVFADGVTVELINRLASVDRLRVVSRSLSFQFKGQGVDVVHVGRKLGVDALVEGSVRFYPEGRRITAQLSDASDGFLLWAGTYTLTSEDPLSMQAEVVDEIREALNAMLQRRGETSEQAAG